MGRCRVSHAKVLLIVVSKCFTRERIIHTKTELHKKRSRYCVVGTQKRAIADVMLNKRSKRNKKKSHLVASLSKEFADNTSMHGLKFITQVTTSQQTYYV